MVPGTCQCLSVSRRDRAYSRVFTPGITRTGGLITLWVAVVTIGMLLLLRFEMSPGPALAGLSDFPADTGIALDSDLPTMVMVAHPRCPCTRASLREFARLADKCRDRVVPHVLFFAPDPADPEWSDTDLWKMAAQIPGVVLHTDRAGRGAHRLGAGTSGTVLVFAPDGRGLFAGGITASRGHEGDNAGSDAVYDAVISGRAQPSESAVFGCSIYESLGPPPGPAGGSA